jgi:uncharacterized protein YkwD
VVVAGLVAAGLATRLGLGTAAPAPEPPARAVVAIHHLRSTKPAAVVTTTTAPAPTTTTTVASTTTIEAATQAPSDEIVVAVPPARGEAKVVPTAPTTLEGWVRRTDLEDELFALHDQARAAAGLAPYAEQGCLRSVAVGWARTMAERGILQHNPDHPRQILSCSDDVLVGENVGVGYVESGGVQGVFDAFMASPDHRSNILDTDFQLMGIGVWSSPDGTIRVAVNFGLL